MTDAREFTFFGIRCEVFRIPADAHGQAFPWRFKVYRPGETEINFVGVPNKCETWRSAMMRAWYRCKWIADGTMDQHYENQP